MLRLIVAALLQWLADKFSGKSTDEKLGALQVENANLKAENTLLKTQKTALENKEDLRDALRHHDF